MQVVIFAGGLGTRLAEKTSTVPKPMVTVGEFPILDHIMNIYSLQGHKEFIIACGYKQDVIKRYFHDKLSLGRTLTLDFDSKNLVTEINERYQGWSIKLIDTGELTQTGSRLTKLRQHLNDEFFVTYGDGVGNVDLEKLLSQHKKHNALITLTTVNPKSRYGSVQVVNDKVVSFTEKPAFTEEVVNAGFMVMNKQFLKFIDPNSETIVLENEPFSAAVAQNAMSSYFHDGFWHPMDTLRDNMKLNDLWKNGHPPWLDF